MESVFEGDLDRQEERLRRLTAAVPAFLLAASTVLALLTGDLPRARLAEVLGLVALAAALVWAVGGPFAARAARPWPGAAFVAALVVLIAALSAHSAWFAGFFGFSGYVYSWQFLRGRWRLAGVAATAAVIVAAYMGGLPDPAPGPILLYVLFVAAVVALVAVFSHFGEVTALRSDERRRMVERLRATIRENEGLHAQLLVQAREAGVHDERRRMAREIHDTLAQGFVGIITQLQAAQRAPEAPGEGAEWRQRVAHALRLARENLAEARRSVHALGPAPLEEAPLPEALAGLTAEWSALTGVRADFAATGPVRPLHTEVEAALLRTVQESLSNVARHAGATRVGVTLSYMEDVVVVDVRDDGAGFAPGGGGWGAGAGFGLRSMRQRAAGLAGTVEIESAPGAGTAVSVAVPALAREAAGG